MKRKLNGLSRRYRATLQKHLQRDARASLRSAAILGRKAAAAGVDTLELVLVHDEAVAELLSPGYSAAAKDGLIQRAGIFFAEVLTPIEKTHLGALEANAQLHKLNRKLTQSTLELAGSNRQLKQEIVQRRAVEEALRKSQLHYSQLLAESHQLQEQLRYLSRQILSAQEEERKKISRELHDEIAQTLTGINVRLATLKTEAKVNIKDLQKKISSTQRMVERSVNIVHRFARELRPAVLDDLGLIPALHSFVKGFGKQTKILVRLTAYAAVEELDGPTRTILYRVAQEALTNVARHAHATRVELTIRKLPEMVRMEIKDNGKSFHVQQVLLAKGNRRLGLLGMRERVEMVAGQFAIDSAPGQGTTIRADIPLVQRMAGKKALKKSAPATRLHP